MVVVVVVVVVKLALNNGERLFSGLDFGLAAVEFGSLFKFVKLLLLLLLFVLVVLVLSWARRDEADDEATRGANDWAKDE